MTGAGRFALKLELQELYDAYVTCLDDNDLESWPDFFTEDCFYQVIPRENWDNGLPLATLRCESNVIRTQANYCVLETVVDEATQVFNAGRYLGVVVREGAHLRFKEKHCVFDSVVVPTSLVYPI
jgi:3-phenylpropionate/cinnamic acid dioxygenase small subunit